MKKAALFALLACFAFGADKIFYHDIKEALASPNASKYLDGSVKFEFGETNIEGKAVTVRGSTNRFRDKKTDEEGFEVVIDETYKKACQYAFFAALRNMQKYAKENGYAVAKGVHGNFKSKIYVDKDKFQCAVGSMLTAVWLGAKLEK